MLKKYIPYIVLLAAVLLLFYIKKYQRGAMPVKPKVDQVITTDNYPVADNTKTDEPFNRHTNHLIYTKHARCRMECRHIDESEVKEVLEDG